MTYAYAISTANVFSRLSGGPMSRDRYSVSAGGASVVEIELLPHHVRVYARTVEEGRRLLLKWVAENLLPGQDQAEPVLMQHLLPEKANAS